MRHRVVKVFRGWYIRTQLTTKLLELEGPFKTKQEAEKYLRRRLVWINERQYIKVYGR